MVVELVETQDAAASFSVIQLSRAILLYRQGKVKAKRIFLPLTRKPGLNTLKNWHIEIKWYILIMVVWGQNYKHTKEIWALFFLFIEYDHNLDHISLFTLKVFHARYALRKTKTP